MRVPSSWHISVHALKNDDKTAFNLRQVNCCILDSASEDGKRLSVWTLLCVNDRFSFFFFSLLSRSLTGQAFIIHTDQLTKNAATDAGPQGDFVVGLFLPWLRVSVIYGHVYWYLSGSPSRWILSSVISSQKNHQWTNCLCWFGIFIEVTHHCGPLCWPPFVTRGKQMVHRPWHVWTLKHLGFMVLFMLFCTFGLHLVQGLLLPFVFLDVKHRLP